MRPARPSFTVDETLQIVADLAHSPYEDEDVDQLEHALQAAQLARNDDGDDELVAAALLHDIGRAPAVLDRYGAGVHEEVGATFCREHLTERCAYMVGQHVPAKRYLVTVDQAYADGLSPASVRSLARQGGGMTPEEVREFEAHPWSQDAARLRRWDDGAKRPGARTDDLASFGSTLRGLWAEPRR